MPSQKNKEMKSYLGNPLLKASNVKIPYTQEQVEEYIKCSNDPVYFIREYVQIVDVDRGLVPFIPYDYQENMIETFDKNRFSIVRASRQIGKSTTVIAFFLHQIIFRDNHAIAILANKDKIAKELLSRLKRAYENLPKWLQQGILEWNKGNISLENGSKILASATSESSIRGQSMNCIFLDEFAHVPLNIQKDFFTSVYPTITSGNTTKVIIVSTPKGFELFYKYWEDAKNKLNSYIPIDVNWRQVPGKDSAWREETIKNTSLNQFEQEYECNFQGSIHTLISTDKIASMAHAIPIYSNKGLDIYEKPVLNHKYVATVDVAQGKELDYSIISIIDVTSIPYKQVAKYRNNQIVPVAFSPIIANISQSYNEAMVLVETNDVGIQTAHVLHYEIEYPNILFTEQKGRKGQVISSGFAKTQNPGVKTTVAVKRIGCLNLKSMIESDKLIIKDYETISELSTFINKKNSWSAEVGHHDDIVMSLVLFGWLIDQQYFKDVIESDISQSIYESHVKSIEEDLLPFGFIDNGIPDTIMNGQVYAETIDGDVWTKV